MTDGGTNPSVDPPGLRERKRQATRQAIQRAVLSLSVDHGFDKVTIDEISTTADVSPRTFFNYFASKEEAIIGDFPTLASEEATAAFIAEGPDESIFAGLSRLLHGAAATIAEDKDANQRRRVLLRQHPNLFARRMSHLHDFEDDLTAIIARRLVVDDPALAKKEAALARRSRLISLIAFAALRYAYVGWIETDGPTPLADYLRDSFVGLDEILASNGH